MMVSASAVKVASEIPVLTLSEKAKLLRGASRPDYFNKVVRPLLLKRCDGDAEKVHEALLSALHESRNTIRRIVPSFRPPKNLALSINGIQLDGPLGTSAGIDKNIDAVDAFELTFSFQEPGTVVIDPRPGNPRIRVAALEDKLDMFNAQGFPSKGLDYSLMNLAEYRAHGGKARIFVSVCGLPLSEENAVQTAMQQMETLLTKLAPYVEGFVWNPFSPNTAALKVLRTPEIFRETAELMKRIAPEKLRLVKLGPYEPEDKEVALGLVKSFIDGGGHGVVTTNTKMFPKEQLPESVKQAWGYPSAGRSGAFLRDYMLTSVKEIRERHPDSVIIATGGIFNADIAYQAFVNGADGLEGYTPYAFYGPGLARRIMINLSEKLQNQGQTLSELQASVKELARKM